MLRICTKIITVLVLTSILSLNSPVWGFVSDSDIEVLTGRDYLKVVLSYIHEAKESVYVKMYLFTEPELAEALIDAYKRGVKVKVILDRLSEKDRKNMKIYKLLKELDIQYDSVDTLTHSKLIVIDGHIVIIGSANWTYNSLFLNNEVSVLIKSPTLAEGYLKGRPVSFGNVVILDEKTYFPCLLKYIVQAKESISVVMYRFMFSSDRMDTEPGLLFRRLVEAHKRGVKVTVILDQQFRSYLGYLGGRETVPVKENFPVYYMLQEEGINVSVDSISRITHAKLVVIDSRISILGSQNWYRHTTKEDQDSIFITSKKVASRLESFINGIERQSSIISKKRLALEGVAIPYSFLIYEDPQHPGCFLDSPGAKLLDKGSKRCFDLYLYLVLEHKSGEPVHPAPARRGGVHLDYKRLACSLGYTREHIKDKAGKYYRYFYKQNIDRLLKKLEELALLRYDKVNHLVYLFQPEYSYKPYSTAGRRHFILPAEFFKYRWPDRLSLKAQYMYLVGLLEDSLNPTYPWWSRSYKGISQMYRISMNTIWEALTELQRQNIIEVYRDAWEPDKPFTSREKNRYFVNPLPDPEELEKTWRRLQKAYGKDTLKLARRLAAELDEPNDPWVVEAFVGLILLYGDQKVKEANSITAKFRRSYGKRHIGYTMAILERKWGF